MDRHININSDLAAIVFEREQLVGFAQLGSVTMITNFVNFKI